MGSGTVRLQRGVALPRRSHPLPVPRLVRLLSMQREVLCLLGVPSCLHQMFESHMPAKAICQATCIQQEVENCRLCTTGEGWSLLASVSACFTTAAAATWPLQVGHPSWAPCTAQLSWAQGTSWCPCALTLWPTLPRGGCGCKRSRQRSDVWAVVWERSAREVEQVQMCGGKSVEDCVWSCSWRLLPAEQGDVRVEE